MARIFAPKMKEVQHEVDEITEKEERSFIPLKYECFEMMTDAALLIRFSYKEFTEQKLAIACNGKVWFPLSSLRTFDEELFARRVIVIEKGLRP